MAPQVGAVEQLVLEVVAEEVREPVGVVVVVDAGEAGPEEVVGAAHRETCVEVDQCIDHPLRMTQPAAAVVEQMAS
jgi:hypothetical protein